MRNGAKDFLTPGRRLSLALLWLALLLGAGWLVGQHLQLSGDLRKFMPTRDSTALTVQIRAASAADRNEITAVLVT